MEENKAIVSASVEFRYPDGWVGACPATMEGLQRVANWYIAARQMPAGLDNLPAATAVLSRCITLGVPFDTGKEWFALVNGRVCMWGDMLPALAQRSGMLEDQEIAFSGAGESRACTVTLRRKGYKTPCVTTYSWGDAKTAGLAGRDTYRKFPDDMIRRRAMGRAYRTLFADAMMGIVLVEDVEDSVAAQAPNQNAASAASALDLLPDANTIEPEVTYSRAVGIGDERAVPPPEPGANG